MNLQNTILLFVFTVVILGVGIAVIDFVKGRMKGRVK
jgi:hypothetical protein